MAFITYLSVSAGLFPDAISIHNIEVDTRVEVNLKSDLIPWAQCRVFAKEDDEVLLEVVDNSLEHPRLIHICGISLLNCPPKFPDVNSEHVDGDYKARILLYQEVNLSHENGIYGWTAFTVLLSQRH